MAVLKFRSIRQKDLKGSTQFHLGPKSEPRQVTLAVQPTSKSGHTDNRAKHQITLISPKTALLVLVPSGTCNLLPRIQCTFYQNTLQPSASLNTKTS